MSKMRVSDPSRKAKLAIGTKQTSVQGVLLLLCVYLLCSTSCLWADSNPVTQKLIQDPLKVGGLAPEMTLIPKGQFIMGAEPNEVGRFPNDGPTQLIDIAQPFYISRYETTFDQYDRFAIATNRALPSDKGWGSEHWGRTHMPVYNVTWQDANDYAIWLSQQTGHRYRLPSEAEWEYAARAGVTTAFSVGNCISTKDANFHGGYQHGDCPVSNVYRGKTTPVGSFAPNNWGLYDVHGNVWEWTEDCWHTTRHGAPQDGSAWLTQETDTLHDFSPPAPADCRYRVLRGGSWSARPRDLRFGTRSHNLQEFKSIFIGFRLLRETR